MMRYTVIFSTGKVLCFYIKEVAEMYALSYNGTMLSDKVLKEKNVTIDA